MIGNCIGWTPVNEDGQHLCFSYVAIVSLFCRLMVRPSHGAQMPPVQYKNGLLILSTILLLYSVTTVNLNCGERADLFVAIVIFRVNAQEFVFSSTRQSSWTQRSHITVRSSILFAMHPVLRVDKKQEPRHTEKSWQQSSSH